MGLEMSIVMDIIESLI